MLDKIRVRFAPSPTGHLHIGTARGALFIWLFARANKGKFILRVEDTDKERSKPEYEKEILDGIKWLGLDWDELYRQSERIDIYKKYLSKLIDEDKAYYCFCTKEDLEVEREHKLATGRIAKYSGRCRSIAREDALKRAINGEKSVIRFKIADKKIVFKDLVRGEIEFDTALFGDIVIAKDLDNPLYNFAVVVDDELMGISHVIRGEDHLSNTPKQILLAEALNFKMPEFAHWPMILNPDRSKMSKRFLDVSLDDYIKDGYLKEAIINFLAFLGWHPKDEKEIMSLEEIKREFSLERMQKAPAVFNMQKLNWLNAQYMARLDIDRFVELARQFLPSEWKLTKDMALSVRGRVKKMAEIKGLVDFYFELPDYAPETLKWKDMKFEQIVENLRKVSEVMENISKKEFNKQTLETVLIRETNDVSKGEIFWPLRVAVSGKKASPSPFEIIEALGKEESMRRINFAIEKASSSK